MTRANFTGCKKPKPAAQVSCSAWLRTRERFATESVVFVQMAASGNTNIDGSAAIYLLTRRGIVLQASFLKNPYPPSTLIGVLLAKNHTIHRFKVHRSMPYLTGPCGRVSFLPVFRCRTRPRSQGGPRDIAAHLQGKRRTVL